MKRKILQYFAIAGVAFSLLGCSNNQEPQTDDEEIIESEEAKWENDEKDGDNLIEKMKNGFNSIRPDLVYFEQVKELTFPEDFESWKYGSESIVGYDRVLYADGHLVNMPNYVGEWEDLLGVTFTEIPDVYGEDIQNYSNNTVCLIDENRVQYFFKINAYAYEREEDPVEELEQLRHTQITGFEMVYDAQNLQYNMSMKDYISLLPDKNLFTTDISTVNSELASLYGAEIETTDAGYHLVANNFDKGFNVEWKCSTDGDSRHLTVEYIPSAYLAYYKYINDELPLYSGEYFSDLVLELSGESLDEINVELMDTSHDGIDEMIISIMGYTVVFYDDENGVLQSYNFGSAPRNITDRGVWVESGSEYEDGRFYLGYFEDADLITTHYYLFDNKECKDLITINKCNKHNEYFINGKLATKEQVAECISYFGEIGVKAEIRPKNEVLEEIKTASGLVYDGIPAYMQNENMYPMKTFDESVLTEITFDESKRGKIEFLMDMIYGRTDMYGYLEMGYYNERSGFAWIDLNSDGEKELLVSPYSWDNVLDMPAMYLEDDEGNYKYKELIDGYIPEKSQLIASYNSAYESLTVFEFDGENLKEVLDIDSGEKYDYYNDEYIVRYHIKDNGNYVEITETEFYNIFNSYKNQAQEIRGELLTMDNIEKVFGVRVCGAGSIMYDTN